MKMSSRINVITLCAMAMMGSLMTSGFHFSVIQTHRRTLSSKNSLRMQSTEQLLYSFDSLKRLDERCSRLTSLESEFMLSFWSESLQCFQIYPNMATERVSATTTCTGLSAILANPNHWQQYAAWDVRGTNGPGKISLNRVINSIKSAHWTGDAFQNPVIVQTLCEFNSFDKTDEKCIHAYELLVRRRSRLVHHRNQPVSSYLRYQNVRAYLALASTDSIPESSRVDPNLCTVGYALERENIVSFDEMCRQLAFYRSGDIANFDVIVLVYSLLAYFETSQSFYLSSFARGVVPLTNIKLIESALKVIFDSQFPDGTWRKGEPINSIGNSGMRDIGNNYVFFFDLVGALLGTIGEVMPELLAPYLMQLERCVNWAETNIQKEMLPETFDPTTGRSYGAVVQGWRSNHLGAGGAVGWCTAQVFIGLSRLHRLLKTLISSRILAEFNGQAASASSSSGGNVRDWANLMDADLDLAGQKTSLKEEILTRILQPLATKEATMLKVLKEPYSEVSSLPSPRYSAILFGPPGTAKTTICTSMASYLGWNFLTIDTACFLSEGLQQIASRMSYIFNRLNALERTVILFDEIEEFCLDRENPNLAMESRMLTTAMLTQLNELRRKQSCVFIVATNRLRSFDAAVTRPGRFDALLFVGTPNLAARSKRLQGKLKSASMAPHLKGAGVGVVSGGGDDTAAVLEFFDSYMQRRWEELRFLTFAENEALLGTVADLALRGELTEEAMDNKITSLLRTATIQGAVKSEYIASEKMSRV